MSTETQVAPVEATQIQATETETPEVVTPEADAETEHEAQPEEGDDAEKALKRMQRRIDKRTADVYRTRAENEQLKARLAELDAKSDKTETTRETVDPHELAEQIASAKVFAQRANELVESGTKKHSDFTSSLKALAAEVGDFVKPNGMPSAFMEAVLEVSDKPVDLLHHLGKNPDIAEDLSGLSPYKLAQKLTRIEAEMTEKASHKTSQAPKPLDPVKPKPATSTLPSDTDTTDDWIKKERARMAAKGLTRYG